MTPKFAPAALAGTALVGAVIGSAVWWSGYFSASDRRDATVLAQSADPFGRRHVLTPEERRHAVAAGLLPAQARSILNLRTRIVYGDYVWDEDGVPTGPMLVQVDLRAQLMSVYRGGNEIATVAVLYGADGHDTPLGSYPIRAKLRDHVSGTYDAAMPFSLMLTGDGVAIHGSDVREGRATHGCIGVPLAFARRLFDAMHVGDEVRIVRSDPKV